MTDGLNVYQQNRELKKQLRDALANHYEDTYRLKDDLWSVLRSLPESELIMLQLGGNLTFTASAHVAHQLALMTKEETS